jgi:tryptophan-rich sensory protein
MEWYDSLAKPTWTPAPSTISLIWMILYPIILVSFGFVFVQAFRGRVGWKVALPLAVNLVANLLLCRSSPGCGTCLWPAWTS